MKVLSTLVVILALYGCKHPLEIVGQGDIVDLNGSGHGCTLEQFQAQDVACTENETFTDYIVNYRAIPRPGWKFVRWEGPCGHLSEPPNCRLEVSAAGVSFWDTEYGDVLIPPTVAVFEKISPAPNQLREFQPGDRIEFQGTLSLEFDINGGAPQSIPISMTFEFFESGFSLEGQPLLALRIAIDGFGSGTSHYLQQANGTFWEVVIDDNWLFDQDRQSFGVLFIPSPLEPFTNQIVNFAELDGDDINSPIEAGRRSIFVRERERITVPLGTFDAYQIINNDTTEIVGCCGETTEYEETNWVVPDAGFIKIQATIWEYKSGVLQTRDSIFVEAVNKNF